MLLSLSGAGVSTKHESKKRKTNSGLFSGDGMGKSEGGAANGASKAHSSSGGSGKGSRSKSNLSKTDLSRLKRGGKGKSSFKSKKKFKRRK